MAGTEKLRNGRIPSGSVFDGRYRVERLLGHGERKQTYLAWDTKTRRQVALAVVTAGAAPGHTEWEVEILGQIGAHPYLVTLYDFSLEADVQYLVFEYLSGGELGDFCRRNAFSGEHVSLPDFFRLARQLGLALGHVHARGVIHRDVSASNVWLDGRGDAHLGDFDTAMSIGQPPVVSPTTTDGFTAPELRGGSELDERADLYSLGAVMYELLVGIAPGVPGEAPLDVTPPSKLRDDLPAGLERLILAMLAPEREERPANAGAVLEALAEIEGRVSDVESLIALGESDSVEFKSSLRTEIPGGGPSKAVERAAIKAVAGFLNGHGGTLLLGVADDGKPIGLESDYRSSPNIAGRDGFERALRTAISGAMGSSVQTLITVTFHLLNGHEVCRVAVEPSDRPVYVTEDNTVKFLLRTGNATNALSVDQAINYYERRWPKGGPGSAAC